MPQIPSKNKIVETARYLTKSIEGYNFINRYSLKKKEEDKKKGKAVYEGDILNAASILIYFCILCAP